MTADSLFSAASEKATGGPPAPMLSSLSEFWLRMSHFTIFFQGRKPHLSPNSASLPLKKLPHPTTLFSLFKSNPTDCTKRHCVFAQQYDVEMWFPFDTEP